MMYSKPKGVSYTDMAIFIDQHAYDKNCTDADNELIFQYLYHIVEMLAYKARFFSQNNYYDDFALEVATSVYMRLKNEKQFIYDENGNPRLKPIKSVLNYIKHILYPKKVDFEQQNYAQTITTVPLNCDVGIGYTFADSLIDSLDEFRCVEFRTCLDDVISIMKKFIYNLPFKKDPAFTENIYLSCLLTFLSMITVDNATLTRVSKLKLQQHRDLDVVDLIAKQFSSDDVILYGIPKQYTEYIYLLTNRIKHLVAQDLQLSINNPVGSESLLKSLIVNDTLLYFNENRGDNI